MSAEILRGWHLKRIRAIGGRFYIVGDRYTDGEATSGLFVSGNGSDWRQAGVPTGDVADIAGGTTGQLLLFTRRGMAYRSVGPGRWEGSVVHEFAGGFRGGQENRVVWNGNGYVALQELGYGTLLATSKDGKDWTTATFTGYDRLYTNLAWNGRNFVAAGVGGLAISRDGHDWRVVDLRLGNYSMRMVHGLAGVNGTTVMTGGGPALLRSTDDILWKGIAYSVPLPKLGTSQTYDLQVATTSARSEREEIKQEQRSNFLSATLIGFSMSGLGSCYLADFSISRYVECRALSLLRCRECWLPWCWPHRFLPLSAVRIFGLWR